MTDGWIKLYRQIQDNPLWTSEPFTRGQAWVDLLVLANHKKGFLRVRGQLVEVERGQVGWSQVKLAKRWSWSRGKIIRFLNELETKQQIEQQKNNITSVISIVNFEYYQGGGTANETADSTTDGQQTDSRRYTNKNEKNNKKKKNNKQQRINNDKSKITDKGARHSDAAFKSSQGKDKTQLGNFLPEIR